MTCDSLWYKDYAESATTELQVIMARKLADIRHPADFNLSQIKARSASLQLKSSTVAACQAESDAENDSIRAMAVKGEIAL